jgi:amino acid adenylation domain-containing protein
LKVDRIGIHDNFFELGGHSLLAARVVARVRSAFNVELPLRKIFELPTVVALAEHIDFLRCRHNAVRTPPVVPVPRRGPIPLSFSQRRLWFLNKVHPGMTAYNIPAAFRIRGYLNVAALEQALNETVGRHESLRTAIVEFGGEPLQCIVPSLPLALPIIDGSALSEAEAGAEIQRLSEDDAQRPFDLAQAPLLRAKLLRLCEEDHVLILNFHHIIADGSSLMVFYQELAAFYEVSCRGRRPGLTPLPVQYADYAIWQREQLQQQGFASQLDYWKRQLAGVSVPAQLPADYARPVVQTFHGARLTRALSEELSQAVRGLSLRQGVTVFMTLLAALAIWLSRQTGQQEVIVGSTIAGRNRREIEGLIGFFINALALRTDVSGNPTFQELLSRVREVCLEAYTHQDVPFDRVVEDINPQRDFSRHPLFQVMFNMADVSERVFHLSGCEITKLADPYPAAKFDITLHAPEIGGKIELTSVYNTELFTESRMAALLEEWDYLLAQAVENPQSRIDDYSLVTPCARAVLPDPTAPLEETWEGAIHQVFSAQAGREPNKLAVVDHKQNWTYREIDARSNQLAHHLVSCGIQPKDVIAIYAHRSAPLVLILLGVLKAGAAFLVLDPAHPSTRLIDYLRIARPKGWIHMSAAGEPPPEICDFLDGGGIGCRVRLPSRKDEIGDLLSPDAEADPGVEVDADDPAYIAFTSGSTGEPKGVVCRHGPITHFLPWQEETFQLTPADRFSLLSGLAYNHLHRDLFTALGFGATVWVPDPETMRDPRRLTEWLQKNQITVLHLTPALGRLLHTMAGGTLPSVRRVFFGGDVLAASDVAMIRQLAPRAEIVSFYGATETQRAVGYFPVPQELPLKGKNARPAIPLGRGAKDVQLLLLRPNRALAGVGEIGELYVRSPHVALGYLGDESLTRQLFTTNPFTNEPADRLYKTGDMGRYLPDGCVEWAGRNDRRVNIRGFRVELAEIESVLAQHPAVREAAVVAKEFTPVGRTENSVTETRLLAYVVSDVDRQSLPDRLRSFLAARVPGHMVPAHFLFLDRLPLSSNGKVAYAALPDPSPAVLVAEDSCSGPRNEIEKILTAIFGQVLGLTRVGVEENFFSLGGHSLLAAQATSRIREAFGIGLELRVFLDSPTVAQLGRQVELLLMAGQPTAESVQADREEIEL